jgi:hypothetical protein
LAWEAAYGTCAAPGSEDFVSRLSARALAPPRASLLAAVVALKDRLLGSSVISASERGELERFLELDLDSPAPDTLESSLRNLCGVLVSSPQFQLGPLVAADAPGSPVLAPAETSLVASCQRVEQWLAQAGTPIALGCSPE